MCSATEHFAANSSGRVLYAVTLVRRFAGAGVLIEPGAQFPVASALKGVQTEHATARVALSLAR